MYQDEPPLNNRELRIVRGMIDDHEYKRMHDKERGEFWTTTKLVLASVTALLTVTIQFATFVVLLSHG